MGFLAYIVLGLIAGAIAKAIMPGKQGGGWLATLILGVVGAVVGGWVGNLIFNVGLESFWSIQTWLLAIVGSLIVLFIYGLVTGKKK
ncbi:GlsB/YeaQ/YmgE family stress response membrane protein [Schaalia vaccimaxillae]|uniref:GlsB/YeaQ/YmgE family stress response membrane protein n=1 Tax=Schaalia vaccimaxillae TaxID=183916 RepID=UPI0003B5C6E4|nr:GlsB/YeaQ/YmgE family stress response membrane protein [Schaalia vaccimaxillae]